MLKKRWWRGNINLTCRKEIRTNSHRSELYIDMFPLNKQSSAGSDDLIVHLTADRVKVLEELVLDHRSSIRNVYSVLVI